ncbi:hypothetical protein LPJ64_002666 [Coemansia asiatica]|uniref:Nudix hydrolase domain-containing protein n=1 Tax=Coemansia asiatica TaxID=1052880 RepID=A0A9W7XJ71_9FUNG|nr:hypothetical protein LPJ64_002666 [Coemansia asiatica]KAJ2858435.1 hypothetical protein FB639_005926 [Coemansia asiatica]
MSQSKQPEKTTLTLPQSNKPVDLVFPVYLHNKATLDQIHKFPPFVSWLQTLDSSLVKESTDGSQIVVDKITLQSIDKFKSGKIGFIKLNASAYRLPEKTTLPGIVFLRGNSVAVLLILRTAATGNPTKPSFGDSDFAVLCEQPRLATGQLNMLELPAGMLDGDNGGGFQGTAAREIQEETGITIGAEDLVELTTGVYPSPGACDELIGLYACEKTMSAGEIEGIRGRLAGLRNDGEFISLRLVPLNQLARETRDMKTLAALHLWDLRNQKD